MLLVRSSPSLASSCRPGLEPPFSPREQSQAPREEFTCSSRAAACSLRGAIFSSRAAASSSRGAYPFLERRLFPSHEQQRAPCEELFCPREQRRAPHEELFSPREKLRADALHREPGLPPGSLMRLQGTTHQVQQSGPAPRRPGSPPGSAGPAASPRAPRPARRWATRAGRGHRRGAHSGGGCGVARAGPHCPPRTGPPGRTSRVPRRRP